MLRGAYSNRGRLLQNLSLSRGAYSAGAVIWQGALISLFTVIKGNYNNVVKRFAIHANLEKAQYWSSYLSEGNMGAVNGEIKQERQ